MQIYKVSEIEKKNYLSYFLSNLFSLTFYVHLAYLFRLLH